MLRILFLILCLVNMAFLPSFGQEAELSLLETSTHYISTNDEMIPSEKEDFLVNTRLYDFDSSKLEPWIEGITHLRIFGVDFRKEKDSNGLFQYADASRVDDLLSFSKAKKLKIVWTLNVTSFTLEQEMAFVGNLIERGLNIVAFEFGGEFYLKKYALGQLSSKGVVERIRMDGENRDYLDLLDLWLPPMIAKYPFDQYEHILITASATREQTKMMKYRREFNRKVFQYVKDNPQYQGVSFSYHLYAGAKPDTYNNDEESVLTPEKVDWNFLNEKPQSGRWVVTESGYYITDFSQSQLNQAKRFYSKQREMLGSEGLIGVHTLYIPANGTNPLAMYDKGGITPVGNMVNNWLSGRDEIDQGTDSVNGGGLDDQPEETEGVNSGNPTSDETPVLVKIYPEFGGLLDWIHFSHTLEFSNGKSYRRSYWFSAPDFSVSDIGKPINYFKKFVKSK